MDATASATPMKVPEELDIHRFVEDVGFRPAGRCDDDLRSAIFDIPPFRLAVTSFFDRRWNVLVAFPTDKDPTGASRCSWTKFRNRREAVMFVRGILENPLSATLFCYR